MLKSEISDLTNCDGTTPTRDCPSNDNTDLNGHTSTVLIVDDDELVSGLLTEVFCEHRFTVNAACSVAEAFVAIEACAPDYAVVDMKLPDGSGLDVIKFLRERQPKARAVVLTGYGSVPQAVLAVKTGAIDFLQKPVDTAVLLSVLMGGPKGLLASNAKVMSAERKRLEHIHKMFQNYGGKVSETARRLGMHRRSLQRILRDDPPR